MTKESESPFADWLIATGKALGYRTNTALAKAIGVPQPTVSRWKSGTKPSVEHLVSTSELLGVELKTLLILAGHMRGNVEGLDLEAATPAIPEGLVPVARDDLRAVLQPAAGQDLTKLTNAALRLREACGLDEPGDAVELVHDMNGYRRGCRCDECREANRVFSKARKAARVARGQEDPSVIPHGLSGYLNWNCRCKTCSWAGSINNSRRGADQ